MNQCVSTLSLNFGDWIPITQICFFHSEFSIETRDNSALSYGPVRHGLHMVPEKKMQQMAETRTGPTSVPKYQ